MWYNNYIDIPYKDGGRDRSGLDCWGLVRLVYKDQYDIDLPSFSDSYTTVKDTERTGELIARHKEQWTKLNNPEQGCVVLMRILGSETHVGIYLGEGKFLHIRAGANSLIESVDTTLWKHRIVGYFKYSENFTQLLDVTAIPHPLRSEKITLPVLSGTKLDFLAEYIKSEYSVNEKLLAKSVFIVNGKSIPPAEWSNTILQENDSVEYRALPGDSSTFRMLAFIVVAIYAPYIANGLLGGAGGFTATTLTAGAGITAAGALTTAAVMIAGSALINAIAPIRPPAGPADPGTTATQNLINGANNQPMQYGAIPVVLGKIRVTPPLGAATYIHYEGNPNIPASDISPGGVAGNITYADMLLVWGYGPIVLDTSTLRIGQVAATDYTNFSAIHLDRQNETTTASLLPAFNATYGGKNPGDKEVGYYNQALACTGLPPFERSGTWFGNNSLPWTPRPKPTVDNDPTAIFITKGFTQQTESVSVSINFPQGLRAIKVQGDGAGNNYPATVGIQLQYKVNNGSWTNWNSTGYYYIGGKLSDSSTTAPYDTYICDENGCGTYTLTRTVYDNEILTGNYIKDAFTWTISLNRQTVTNGTITATRWQPTDSIQVRVRRVSGDETEPNADYRYSHQMVLQSIVSYNNSSPAIDPPNSKIAKSAISVQATDQLNGQIDAINAIVQSVCLDWNNTNTAITSGTSYTVTGLGSTTLAQWKAFFSTLTVVPTVGQVITATATGTLAGGATTGIWVTRATSNPASLFRYVLQHPANPQPVPDSQLNLVQLQHWHEYCNTAKTVTYIYNGITYTYSNVTLQYNSVVGGSQRGVLEILRDIASAGRASPAMLDGKWTVVIDEPKSSIVQHFTPHNSWGFEATKLLPRMPSALRVQFNDKDSDYEQKEIVVGYSGVDVKNPTLVESIQLPGVTSTGEAIDHARWHLAQIKLRPEVYVINTDIEYIVCNRGDRVKVTHDVPMWGSGSGRVKNLYGTSSTNITVLQLDEELLIDSTKNYTIRIRNSSTGASSTFNINKSFSVASISRTSDIVTITMSAPHPISVGEIVSVNITTNPAVNLTGVVVESVLYNANGPIGFTYTLAGTNISTTSVTGTVSLVTEYYKSVQLSTATNTTNVQAGDLILFGELNNESQDLIVTKIEPTTNKTARITLVDYGVTSTYNIFTDYISLSSNTLFAANITEPPKELKNLVGDLVPILSPDTFISDERVIRQLSQGVFEYIIRVPFTNPPDLSNDIGYVRFEVIPANVQDTSGSKIYTTELVSGSIDIPDVQESNTYRFRARYVTKSGKVGPWTDWFGHKVVGKTNPPKAVTLSGTGYVLTGNTLKLTWVANSEIDISGYEIRALDSGWGTYPSYLFLGNSTEYIPKVTVTPGQTQTWYIRSVDLSGNYSTTTTSISYTYPTIPNPANIKAVYNTSSLTEATLELKWDNVSTSTFGVSYYEITYYDTVDGVPDTLVTKQTMSTSIILPANWLGDRTFTVKVVDFFSNKSTGSQATLTKSAPNPVTNFRAQVIDNNVLLYWNYGAKTTLPIAHALLKKGTASDTWATATSIGTKSGEFTSISELSSGTYTYFIAAVDTDGRESTVVQLPAVVAQPPDFKFNAEYTSTLNATKVNATSYAGELFMPVNTTETWSSHFTSRSWNTPQDQITAGYPVFVQPGTTNPGYYEEVFDYGTILGSSQITLTKTETLISGTATITSDIAVSSDGTNYTNYGGVTSIFATSFRYIKIRITVTPTSGLGVVYKLSSLKVRLDAKQKTEANSATVTSSGTIVNFETEFVDVQSVTLTASGTTPLTAVYDLKDSVAIGTYSVTSNVCTVTIANHGLVAGQKVRVYFTSGTAPSGLYIIQSATTNTYTLNITTGNTSGNVTTYPNSMILYAFVSNTGAATSANISYTIRGY